MELTEIASFESKHTRIRVKRCQYSDVLRGGPGIEIVDYTIFVANNSGGNSVMFTFDTKEEAISLFRHMLTAKTRE